MSRKNIVQQLRTESQHLLDARIHRDQLLRVAGLMRDAADAIERFDGYPSVTDPP